MNGAFKIGKLLVSLVLHLGLEQFDPEDEAVEVIEGFLVDGNP